jgi:hypothetical protein
MSWTGFAARNEHGFSVQEHLMRLANEVPRSVAMLAAMGEGKGGTAAESEESNSRDLSQNVENGAQNGGRQKRHSQDLRCA